MHISSPDNLKTAVPFLCRDCRARHSGICSVLNASELVEFAQQTRKTRYVSGSELIGDNAPILSYANVMSGVVKLTKVLGNGRQQMVGLQFAPDFLGRLFGIESNLTAEAASAVHLCVVPRGALEQMVATTPALGHRLMHQTLRELDEARDWMVTLGRKSARQKVASFLCLLATHADTGSDSEDLQFDLPLTRVDIGDFLGLTFETVSRQLTSLRVDGAIRVSGTRHIEVPDMQLLRELCG